MSTSTVASPIFYTPSASVSHGTRPTPGRIKPVRRKDYLPQQSPKPLSPSREENIDWKDGLGQIQPLGDASTSMVDQESIRSGSSEVTPPNATQSSSDPLRVSPAEDVTEGEGALTKVPLSDDAPIANPLAMHAMLTIESNQTERTGERFMRGDTETENVVSEGRTGLPESTNELESVQSDRQLDQAEQYSLAVEGVSPDQVDLDRTEADVSSPQEISTADTTQHESPNDQAVGGAEDNHLHSTSSSILVTRETRIKAEMNRGGVWDGDISKVHDSISRTQDARRLIQKSSHADDSVSSVRKISQDRVPPPEAFALNGVGKPGHERKSTRMVSASLPTKARQPSNSDTEEISVISDALPRQIVFGSDFDVNHVPEGWEESFVGTPPFDPSMNCFGVVHVRILRAQRLPCPVGSSVQAIVSLPPWKGRIRTRKASAFAGSRRCGVCTDWSDDEEAMSMVHAYSSEESPVPSIEIKIVFGTLGVFEFDMCSLTLSCEPLLRQPMTPLQQWCRTIPKVASQRRENIPLVQIEAMFEPEEKTLPIASTAPIEDADMRKYSADESFLESTPSPIASVTGSTAPQTPNSVEHQPPKSDRPLQPVYETKTSAPEPPAKQFSPQRESLPSPSRQTAPIDDKSDMSVSMMSRKMLSSSTAKGHLLRKEVFYSPTKCSVCGKSITSGMWKVSSFRCEECGVECCGDCRLQIDIQLPCGSSEAQKAAKNAFDAKFTTEKLLQWVAPIEKTADELASEAEGDTSERITSRFNEHEHGIGKLKLNFIQACAFSRSLPPETALNFDTLDLSNLKRSDYYVRIVRLDSTGTARTRTVQQSTRPQFDFSEVVISVPHYAAEFRVELVDAVDDTPIGFLLLTTQMLLQEQRDDTMKHSLLPLPLFKFRERRIVRELRRFVKSGSPAEYFPEAGSKTGGEVVGLIEFQVVLEEDFSAMYGSIPYLCPPRPKDEFDLARIRAHIQRISQIVADVNATLQFLNHMTSWENPFLSLASFAMFAYFCYTVYPDHFFTGPVFLAIICMGYLALLRTNFRLQHEYESRQLAVNRKNVSHTQNTQVHRPAGLIQIIVDRGRNIRSPELGLSGSVSCRVSIDLCRDSSQQLREKLSNIDGAVGAPHVIGTTDTVFSVNPKWNSFEESEESKRLRHIIPNHEGFFHGDREKQSLSALEFPVLQPISRRSGSKDAELEPWSASKAAVIFEVMFHDLANIIPGSEYCIGEVVVPLRQLVLEGECSGWFKLSHGPNAEFTSVSAYHRDEDRPAINVQVKWLPPTTVEGLPPDIEAEASIVVQEELSRAAKLAKRKHGGLVGTSLGAIDTVRGISGYLLAVQNGLGSVLDTIEAARNLVNFTDPTKSFLVVAVLYLLWLVLYYAPFRFLVFILGSLPYVLSFKSKYLKRSRQSAKLRTSTPEADQVPGKPAPATIWITNFLRSLPVDEDLKRTYFWETRRKVAKLLQEEADSRRASRLQKLWRAQWYEAVQVLRQDSDSNASPWFESAFAVIQGRRFMLWKSATDFDSGEQPVLKVFLRGHAGLATPSPIELKAIGSELSRSVSIFGRGEKEQQRITILTSGPKSKEELEDAVFAALNTKGD